MDNKTGEYASWDFVALMDELQGLDWKGLELDWGLDGEEEEPEEPEKEEKEEDFDYECPECGFRFNA